MADQVNEASKFNKRLERLKADRSPYMTYYIELADHILFNRGRFLLEADRKPKRNLKQYNNTPKRAARTLASGMMAGVTSPARPWFALNTVDPDLSDRRAVKQWLHECEMIMYRVFASSNFYNSIHQLYSELGVFATGAMGIYEDYNDVIRCKTYTVGSYCLAAGAADRVDTFYVEYSKTVGELVKEFGKDNVSRSTLEMWNKGSTEALVNCVHAIEPNDDRDMMSPLAADMPYRSVHYEIGKSGVPPHYLRKSGFNDFAVMTPRWEVSPENVYGDECPGMMAIGDSKALQLGERRKYQALDILANPPLQGPSSVKNAFGKEGRPKPGSYTSLDTAKGEIKSIYGSYQPRMDYLQVIQAEVEQRINEAFYVDLFLMLANTDRRQITAREVAEKHEEKLLMLGPVLERVHAELLDPAIDRTFNICQRNGLFPPVPQELVNVELKVEYVSVLAQAQQMVGISAIERTAAFAAHLTGIWPEARHKLDAAQAVDDYASSTGVNPRLIRSDDEVAERQAAEAQAQAQQAQMQQGVEAAKAAKDASQATVQDDNALGIMLRNAGLM